MRLSLLDDAHPRLALDRARAVGRAVQRRVVEHEDDAVGSDVDVWPSVRGRVNKTEVRAARQLIISVRTTLDGIGTLLDRGAEACKPVVSEALPALARWPAEHH